MLDLEKLALPFSVLVPILGDSFTFAKKRHRVRSSDGWFVVRIDGNEATVVEDATGCSFEYMGVVNGYTCNNSFIFQNGDVARRKWKLPMQVPLYFNQEQTFSSVRAVVWEDGMVYYVGPNYSDVHCLELRDLEDLNGKKGITPELRSVFLFHALERERARQLAEAVKKKQNEAELMKSIPGRLALTFKRAGAELIAYNMSGYWIIVDWRLLESGHEFNSVIDSQTWMIRELGFCASRDDKRHNITSAVKTAEDYSERGLIYKTRD